MSGEGSSPGLTPEPSSPMGPLTREPRPHSSHGDYGPGAAHCDPQRVPPQLCWWHYHSHCAQRVTEAWRGSGRVPAVPHTSSCSHQSSVIPISTPNFPDGETKVQSRGKEVYKVPGLDLGIGARVEVPHAGNSVGHSEGLDRWNGRFSVSPVWAAQSECVR